MKLPVNTPKACSAGILALHVGLPGTCESGCAAGGPSWVLLPLIAFRNKPEKPVLMYSCYTVQCHIIAKGSMCRPVSILEKYIEDTMVTFVLN